MKKVTVILFSFLMIIFLAACSENTEPKEARTVNVESSTEISSEENTLQKNTADVSETAENNTQEQQNDIDTNKSKVLVAYFSATGTTKTLAEYVADGLNADIYEIVPKEPYTDADLNYNDDKSRSTIEMNDSAARPEISDSVENMEQYDIVFIGYPIWWSEAPRIINTFVESYDFSRKTIIPFCTSGGSGIGSSASNLQKLSDGEWLSGESFNGGSSRSEVIEWINSLGLNVTAE